MDAFILNNHPKIVGTSSPAQHEIHIFLLPLNPDDATVKSYYDAVDKWNATEQGTYSRKFGNYQMKACLLCLVFREKDTFAEKSVFVMQSSVYIKSNDMAEVINETHNQAAFFELHGFQILREKIEAMAYGIQGVPQTAEQVVKYEPNEFAKSPYFEFHIKCQLDNEVATDDPISIFKKCSDNITVKYESPCPLSYNVNPHQFGTDYAGNQRFLNIRFRNLGLREIDVQLKLVHSIIETEKIHIIKRISEYVWYDTNPEVDAGWIDFNPGEEKLLLEYLWKNMI